MESRTLRSIKRKVFEYFKQGRTDTWIELKMEITGEAVKKLRAMYEEEKRKEKQKLLAKVKEELMYSNSRRKITMDELKNTTNYFNLTVGDVIL